MYNDTANTYTATAAPGNQKPIPRYIAQLVMKSENRKTGKIPTLSYPRVSCPASCSLLGSSCYAEKGYYTRLNWDYIDRGKRGAAFDSVMDQVEKLPAGIVMRDKVQGDEYAQPGNPDNIDPDKFERKIKAFENKTVISYTHHLPNAHNLKLLRKAARRGLHVNLSADNVVMADKLARHKLPIVSVVHSDTPKISYTPKGRKVIVCPAQTAPADRVTCSSCKLCADGGRDYIIGFRAHGGGTKKLNAAINVALKVS